MEWIFFALFGLIFGSAANAIIYRLRAGESWWRGRSHCPHCRVVLAIHELVPLISWLVQRGRCRACRQWLGWQYPLVELAMMMGALAIYVQVGWTIAAVGLFIFWWVLLIIFVYDLRYGQILDVVTIPGIIFALAWRLGQGWPWWSLLIGGAIGAGWFLIQYALSAGRWVGDGDIRLGALMGAMLGWPVVIIALMIGYITGAIVGVALLLTGKATRSSAIPFGPFLVIGTMVALWWGPQLITWYRLALGL